MKLPHASWLHACLLSWPATAAAANPKPPTWTTVSSHVKRYAPYGNSTWTTIPVTRETRTAVTTLVTQTTVHKSVPTEAEPCTTLKPGVDYTVFLVWQPDTITITGDLAGYTPPYPLLSLPTFCEDPPATAEPGSKTMGSSAMTSQTGIVTGWPGNPEPPGSTLPPRRTITIFTTDKNPAVVHITGRAPDYSQTALPGNAPDLPTDDGHQTTAKPVGNLPAPTVIPQPPQDGPPPNDNKTKSPPQPPKGPSGAVPGDTPPLAPPPPGPQPAPRPTFTVSAGGNEVIINNSTFSRLQPSRTSVVTVDDGTFTIRPTAVQGEGAIITKPVPQGGDVVVPKPTGGIVGGLPVTISGSKVVVGGTSLLIPPAGTTTVIGGKDVTIGPGAVIVGDHSITFSAVAPIWTDLVVAGGEDVEVIGRSIVVIHSTTITYGPGIAKTSKVVGGETVFIGPEGVVVHGITMGGPSASESNTAVEVVGGLTITAAGASVVAIDGTTFTVGPGASTVTTVIRGQTITIGPSEAILSSTTYSLPRGTGVVTTILPPGATTSKHPVETGARTNSDRGGESGGEGGSEDEEDSDSATTQVRPGIGWGMAGVCIAIGVLLLG